MFQHFFLPISDHATLQTVIHTYFECLLHMIKTVRPFNAVIYNLSHIISTSERNHRLKCVLLIIFMKYLQHHDVIQPASVPVFFHRLYISIALKSARWTSLWLLRRCTSHGSCVCRHRWVPSEKSDVVQVLLFEFIWIELAVCQLYCSVWCWSEESHIYVLCII